MKSPGFAALVFGAVASVALLVGPAAAAPGPDVYGAHAAIRNAVISPDGKHVAMITTNGEDDVVSILKIGGSVCRIGQGKENKLRGLYWANNDRLIAVLRRTAAYWGDSKLRDWSGSFSMSTQCDNVKAIKAAGFVGWAPDGYALMTVPQYGTPDRDRRLRQTAHHGWRLDLQRVNPATGALESYERSEDGTYDWMVDDNGRAKLRFDADPTGRRTLVYARIGDVKDWVLVYDGRSAPTDDDEYGFASLGAAPDTAYVSAYNGGDKRSLFEFNLKTRQLGRKIASNSRVDVGGLSFAGYSTRAVGVRYADDTIRVDYFDRAYQQMQADLRATFPGENVWISSAAKDLKTFVAFVEGATNPGGAYHYVETGVSIAPIGAMYPALRPSDIGAVKFIEYAARDGYKIPAYLTLPYGSSGKNLPLVVMPHGGPEARDLGGFDSWAQFLASRGYAVLQPQYRASTGFGLAHRNAGRKQWGLLVQDDISDGVTQMIGMGIADRSRVCIVGWSFGGYATLAGLAFTPDLYKCGVAGAGVSDLGKMLRWERDQMGRGQGDDDYFTKAIGYWTKDEKRLNETSPAQHAAKFKAPVLLIHGKDDTVVPKEQSDIMAEALKAAGKPYEYVVLDGEDHHLSRSSTSKEFMRQLDRFLAKHLK